MTPRIVLIGPPGAGKSSIGSALSRKLKLGFADTDTMIEEDQGKSVSQIFIDDGEEIFREIERKICLGAFEEQEGVLALGGGAVLDPITRAALAKLGSEVIFLDVSLKVAAPRIGFNRDRPLLLNNPRQKWQELMDSRRPIYEEVSTLHYQTGDQSVAEVVKDLALKVKI
ncbi:MAG: shikimate kinase [Actinobacteria bacterium]|nr:shikimate kinase [Actinomycetota bacterium]